MISTEKWPSGANGSNSEKDVEEVRGSLHCTVELQGNIVTMVWSLSSSVEHGKKNLDTDPTDKQATSFRVDLFEDISREGQTVQANSKAELWQASSCQRASAYPRQHRCLDYLWESTYSGRSHFSCKITKIICCCYAFGTGSQKQKSPECHAWESRDWEPGNSNWVIPKCNHD